jgi:hypothetical protein
MQSLSPRTGRLAAGCAALAALVLLPACGSASHKMVIQVNPPEASVYINGQRVGQGERRPHDLSFDRQERVYVQATAPGYEPQIEWFDLQKVEDMIDRNLDLAMTLRQRR